MNNLYHSIFYGGLFTLLSACGPGTQEGSIRLSREEYVAPFQNQYDNLNYEIDLLEQEYAILQKRFITHRSLHNDSLRYLSYYKRFDVVQKETSEVLESLRRIEDGLTASLIRNGLDTITDGNHFRLADIREPHSNKINRSYFKSFVQNIGSELNLKIAAYNKTMRSSRVIENPEDSTAVLIYSRLYDKPDPNNSEPFYWEDFSLINVPIVSCLTELKSLRVRVLKTGLSAGRYVYGRINALAFKFSSVSLYMDAESMQIHKNETVKIRMGIKAWNEDEEPLIIINGDTATRFEKGEAIYLFKPRKTGVQKLKGELFYADPRTGEQKTASTSLTFKVEE